MDITGLHHVGHVVRDMSAARALYERMGFRVPPPAFPALPAATGGPPRAFGAGNTHVAFRDNFLELVTVVDGEVDPAATLVPLEVPPEALARVAAGITATSARGSAALARFEGLHILVFETPDADAAAVRLSAADVPHDGVTRVRRGPERAPLGFVEIDGSSPEGRLALAEALPGEPGVVHPNGGYALVGAVLCVADGELDATARRYTRYLARPARAEGATLVFDLDGAQVVLVAAGDLGEVLPGERPPPLPAFVAAVLAVRDLASTAALLARNDVPVHRTPAGGLLVPATAALGAALVFREG